MKKEMSWLTMLVLIVLIAVGLNVIRAADWKYDESLPDSQKNTLQKIVAVISSYYTYTGWSRSGASGADACWRVLRMYTMADGVTTSYMYYNGDASFNAVWNDKETATYR